MKKRVLFVFLVLSLFMFSITACSASKTGTGAGTVTAVYLGVVDYGIVQADDKDSFRYRFSIEGDEVIYGVSNANDYEINNILAEGYVFDLTVKDDTVVDISIPEPYAVGTVQSVSPDIITVDGDNIKINSDTKIYEIICQAGGAKVEDASLETGRSVKVYGNPADFIYLTFVAEPYQAPVRGTAGNRTIKNFLATAMEPVGTALYVCGGNWNWQDAGSSKQATTIGLSQTWLDFFQSQDDTYSYMNENNFSESYYPHNGYIEYYYAGIDCSGYIGWTVYNVMNTENGKDGYVGVSTNMAMKLDQEYNYGTWTRDFTSSDFKAGDVFSMLGHIWICLGVCEDGSLMIVHSVPSDSKSGSIGGGVQLSGVGKSEDCKAYALAKEYMERYYPEWSDRYPAIFRNYSIYTSTANANSGKFSWNLDETGLLDPEGYTNMSAEEILRDLFGES
ncbi:copper amine oxidase N-terminal domain-containing protein [Sedimentibacter sp.]|uniref:copper amine oxidase N-terminal domain-containing protein n=1 Tax=Sedimentibacter sp. TaxID=1960295 RepID=UPI002899693B|nr:copper amine oxidase N-terminal domain-containing protein [Sedimentibacter sp.]